MSRHRISAAVLATALLALVPVGHASAETAVGIVALEQLPGGHNGEPRAINEAGHSAGLASGADGQRHVVRWAPDGAITDLGASGDTTADDISINEHGQVVATFLTGQWPQYRHYATRWSAQGGYVELGTLPGGEESWAKGIDDRGYVFGNAYARHPDGALGMHAVRWDQWGRITDLGPGQIYSVSGSGFAVGAAYPGGPGRAARWDRQGNITLLESLHGAVTAEAYRVNDAGLAVGVTQFKNGISHAVRWDRQGRATDLGTLPGGADSSASSISSNGLVAGYSTITNELFPKHAVRWDQWGRITDLGTLPGSDPMVQSSPSGINRYGTVIGHSDFNIPVFWDWQGRITELHGLDGGRYGTVWAINDKGFAVGTSSTGPTLWRLPR